MKNRVTRQSADDSPLTRLDTRPLQRLIDLITQRVAKRLLDEDGQRKHSASQSNAPYAGEKPKLKSRRKRGIRD
ncbi:MAG: hypothetical protein WD851_20835 [Pirellulales bacterium]